MQIWWVDLQGWSQRSFWHLTKYAIFELTEVDMERVSGSESFADVLANTGNLRLRFENTQQASVLEYAHIDSIEAIKELPKSGTTIQLGQLRIKNDSEEI